LKTEWSEKEVKGVQIVNMEPFRRHGVISRKHLGLDAVLAAAPSAVPAAPVIHLALDPTGCIHIVIVAC